MNFLFKLIGSITTFTWSIISSIIAVVPICLIGGLYILRVYSETATIEQWGYVTVIMIFTYVVFTELGCWFVELLNNTVVNGHLSKIAYRFVTVLGVSIIVTVMYFLQSVLGGLLV